MRVRFWGTRGSLAKPGPDTVRYGGNTACVELRTDAGTLVILDCGTGAHGLGQELLEREGPDRGHILISHTHWDHIQGIPFFTPLFVPGNEWHIYGPGGLGESLQEALAGQMQYTYFPVTLHALGADVRYHDLVEGSFRLGEIEVRTRYLNHPALTLAYRLEADGVAVVYACDHEPHSRALAVEDGEVTGQDLEHAEFLKGADLVIHDAQYTAEEYQSKVGWGHSSVEYAVRICSSAGVKSLALTHHDPLHDDDALDAVVEAQRATLAAAGSEMELFAAAEGESRDLKPVGAGHASVPDAEPSALRDDYETETVRVLVGVNGSAEATLIEEAAAGDEIEIVRVAEPGALLDTYVALRPSVVILDRDAEGLETSRSIRALGDGDAREVPIVLVASEPGDDEAVTDWLLTPFSAEYARSRIRAWALRSRCRWVPAGLPADEPQRLAALHDLNVLDTPPEERFDRITRLAAGLLGTPVSLVTLIDEDRQWFKAKLGTEITETPREVAFCAHTILGNEPFVVPDALADQRFADNPVVAGPPHVRFYAGCPVTLPGGHSVGSLCVLDLRPRQLTPEQLVLLRDLADLVEEELARGV